MAGRIWPRESLSSLILLGILISSLTEEAVLPSRRTAPTLSYWACRSSWSWSKLGCVRRVPKGPWPVRSFADQVPADRRAPGSKQTGVARLCQPSCCRSSSNPAPSGSERHKGRRLNAHWRENRATFSQCRASSSVSTRRAGTHCTTVLPGSSQATSTSDELWRRTPTSRPPCRTGNAREAHKTRGSVGACASYF